MSDNSFKSKARARQKATGSSYMRARREVDTGSAAPAVRIPSSVDAAKMLSLIGLDHADTAEISALWADRALPIGTDGPVDLGPYLRVPMGLQPGGAPVWLDLKGGAPGPDGQRIQGYGPHGLLVGCTGSGKSVASRTVLFGLCAQHSPELLQLVLVGTRHGEAGSEEGDIPATFAAFAHYPHVAAVVGESDCRDQLEQLMADRARALRAADAITLQDGGKVSFVDDGAVSWAYAGREWPRVDGAVTSPDGVDVGERLADASEPTSPERALQSDTGCAAISFEPAGSIGRYNQVRATAAGAELPAVPYTVVVVDEWPRLASHAPECIAVFNTLVRKGQSLGIHVLLTGQVAGDRQIAENVGYRIALRVNDMAASRDVIGSDAAWALNPEAAGVGVFRPHRRADLVTFRTFLLPEDWVRDVGRRLSDAV